MNATITVSKEVDVKTLRVVAHVRYWCDATVNGVEGADDDEAADPGIPCREGETWKPVIDVDSGRITNWKQGTTASTHYKVCDAGVYILEDAEGNEVGRKEGYVPEMLAPKGKGYGDYIKLDIDAEGFIEGWNPDLSEILEP